MDINKENQIPLLGTLVNSDESGIIAHADQIFDVEINGVSTSVHARLIDHDDKMEALNGATYVGVTSLPTTGAPNTIYLVPTSDSATFTANIYGSNGWVTVGTYVGDLTNSVYIDGLEGEDEPDAWEDPVAVESSYAYNWKTTGAAAKDGSTEGNLKTLYNKVLDTEAGIVNINSSILNVNAYNSKTTAYTSRALARQAIPSTLLKNGLIVTYLVTEAEETKWVTEQYSTQGYKTQVTTADIADSSITTDKIDDDAVTNDKLADDSVGEDNIIDDSVSTDKLQDASITTDKVADEAVTTDKIADNSISSTKLQDNSIVTSKINSKAVTTEKIADNAITATQIANGAITTDKLASSTVTSDKLNNGSVTASKIANNAITAGSISSNAVTSVKIADSAITSTKIADGSITTSKIAEGNITTSTIANNAVTNGKLASNSVATANIASGAVTADKLASNSVTSAKIASNAITTAKIQDDAINNDKLADNAVGTSNILNSSVTTAKIANGAVTEDKVAAGSITSSKIADDAITSDKLASNSVGSDTIADNSITTAKIASQAVTSAKLANNSVGTTAIVNSAVNTSKLSDNAVTTAKLADSSVTASKLTDNTITTSKVTDNAITADKLESRLTISKYSDASDITDSGVEKENYYWSTILGGETAGNASYFKFEVTEGQIIKVFTSSSVADGGNAYSVYDNNGNILLKSNEDIEHSLDFSDTFEVPADAAYLYVNLWTGKVPEGHIEVTLFESVTKVLNANEMNIDAETTIQEYIDNASNTMFTPFKGKKMLVMGNSSMGLQSAGTTYNKYYAYPIKTCELLGMVLENRANYPAIYTAGGTAYQWNEVNGSTIIYTDLTATEFTSWDAEHLSYYHFQTVRGKRSLEWKFIAYNTSTNTLVLHKQSDNVGVNHNFQIANNGQALAGVFNLGASATIAEYQATDATRVGESYENFLLDTSIDILVLGSQGPEVDELGELDREIVPLMRRPTSSNHHYHYSDGVSLATRRNSNTGALLYLIDKAIEANPKIRIVFTQDELNISDTEGKGYLGLLGLSTWGRYTETNKMCVKFGFPVCNHISKMHITYANASYYINPDNDKLYSEEGYKLLGEIFAGELLSGTNDIASTYWGDEILWDNSDL